MSDKFVDADLRPAGEPIFAPFTAETWAMVSTEAVQDTGEDVVIVLPIGDVQDVQPAEDKPPRQGRRPRRI